MSPPADGGGFPVPPKGEPGGIRSAARSLKAANRDLEEVATGLAGATGALDADWRGWAAGQFRATADQFRGEARQTAGLFSDAASAVEDYAGVLEQAQRALAKLKVAYDDAKRRESAATGQMDSLAGRMLSGPTDQVSEIETEIGRQGDIARTAGDDAQRILGKANQVMDEFRREESKAARALNRLSGNADGSNTGLGASRLNNFPGNPGLVNIPGYRFYWISRHEGGPLGDDSLLNPIDLIAGIATGGLSSLGRKALSGAAKSLAKGAGIAGEGTAAREAERKAIQRVMGGVGHHENFRRKMIEARAAGRTARANAQVDFANRRGETAKQIFDGLGKAGVPFPAGTEELGPHVIQNATVYRYYVVTRLLTARQFFSHRVGPGARAMVRKIGFLSGGK